MADGNLTRISCPDRGMNRSVSPRASSSQRSWPTVQNLLPGYDRRAPVRGPVWDIFGGTLGSTQAIGLGYHSAFESVLIRDPSVAASGGFIVHNGVNLVTNGTFSVSVDSSRPLIADPAMRSVTLRNIMYYVSGVTGAILPSSFANRYGQLPVVVPRWTGDTTAPTLGTTGSYPNPGGAIDIIVHLDRLFQLGGADTAMATDWGEKLFWTDVGGGPAGVVAEWTADDGSGLLNKIDLGSAGGKLMKLGIVNRNLAIFRENSIQMLYGDTPSSWSLRTVMNNIGIVRGSNVISFDDACIFLSAKGVMMWDGSNLSNISEPIDPVIQRLVSRTNLTTSTFARIDSDHFMLTIVDSAWTSTEGISFVCHVPTGSWFKFTTHTDLFPGTWGGGPRAVYEIGARGPLGWAGTKGYYLSHIGLPFLSDQLAPTWRIGRDRVDAAGNYRYIPWQAETPLQALGSPMANGKLNRLGMYYVNRGATTGDITVNVGTREVQGEISNGSLFSVPSSTGTTASSNTPYDNGPLDLAIWDVMQEMRDTQIIVTGPTGAVANSSDPRYMELGDLYLEWQATRPR